MLRMDLFDYGTLWRSMKDKKTSDLWPKYSSFHTSMVGDIQHVAGVSFKSSVSGEQSNEWKLCQLHVVMSFISLLGGNESLDIDMIGMVADNKLEIDYLTMYLQGEIEEETMMKHHKKILHVQRQAEKLT